MSQWRRPARLLGALGLLTLGLGTGMFAQSTGNKAVGASADDPDFARAVKEWTTKPEFSSPLVDHLPKVAGVPSPKDVLGHHIGAPKKLTYYADILKYYRALAAASPRVKVITIGKSNEGRELVVVFVGADESIKNLETYRGYLAQLADPRKISDAQAQEIVAKAKPIYHLSGGLHSGEIGPSEMLMELAYRVAVEDSPLVKKIRDNVIVSITPVADPDGRDRNVDWYYKYGINETDGRTTGAGVPYWGKYIFHDNNRDINYSQIEMRALLDWYLQWHPPIMHDLHEAQTLLYTFSGQAPQNPESRSDPLRRAADDGELRDGADDQVRHAGRVDARLRRHVVARLSRVHVLEPQRHDPDVRDSGHQRREHDQAAARQSERAGQRRPGGARPAAADAVARPRRTRRRSPPDAAIRRSATGSVRGRRPASSTGRCATTPTTARPAC